MSRPIRPARLALVAAVLLAILALVAVAHAASFGGRFARATQDRPASATMPENVHVLHDIAYGPATAQRLDVYVPAAGARRAPVLLMVHGGGWRRGDKDLASVVTRKVARWVPRGFVFVSVDYRMLPEADPRAQAQDVARALAYVQRHASDWGGDPDDVVLMGHSAGAHLVALLEASPTWATEAGAGPWRGSVLLDSGALDVPALMTTRHLPLFDDAFGDAPAFWRALSPQQQLAPQRPPVLAVCSTRRDRSCAQSAAFVAAARDGGTQAGLLREDLSHREINMRLGDAGAYTDAVERFLASLGDAFARRLR